MTDNKHAEAVEVTQADREAAVVYIKVWAGPSTETDYIVEGRSDNSPLVQAFARHRLDALNTRPDVEAWQHVKRGTVYEVIGRAELQTVSGALVDGSEMVVYRGEDGKLWCREEGEFMDGRFRSIPVPTSPSQ